MLVVIRPTFSAQSYVMECSDVVDFLPKRILKLTIPSGCCRFVYVPVDSLKPVLHYLCARSSDVIYTAGLRIFEFSKELSKK